MSNTIEENSNINFLNQFVYDADALLDTISQKKYKDVYTFGFESKSRINATTTPINMSEDEILVYLFSEFSIKYGIEEEVFNFISKYFSEYKEFNYLKALFISLSFNRLKYTEKIEYEKKIRNLLKNQNAQHPLSKLNSLEKLLNCLLILFYSNTLEEREKVKTKLGEIQANINEAYVEIRNRDLVEKSKVLIAEKISSFFGSSKCRDINNIGNASVIIRNIFYDRIILPDEQLYKASFYFGLFIGKQSTKELLSIEAQQYYELGLSYRNGACLPLKFNLLPVYNDDMENMDNIGFIKNEDKLTTWEDVFKLITSAKIQTIDGVSGLIKLLCILRASKFQPGLISGTANIEEIAIAFNKFLENSLKNPNITDKYLNILYLLYLSLPSNINAVNEYRISSWNWFKAIAEITHKENIQAYEEIEKKLINLFHDSPSPYHLNVVRDYFRYVTEPSEFTLKALNRTVEPLALSFPDNYLESKKGIYDELIVKSEKLLKAFENIYGEEGAEKYFHLLKGISDRNIRRDLISLVSQLTGYSENTINDAETLLEFSKFKVYEPNETNINTSLAILDISSNLVLKALSKLKQSSSVNKSIHLNMISVLCTLAFKEISYFNDIENELSVEELKKVIKFSTRLICPICPVSLKPSCDALEKELNLSGIKYTRLLYIANRTHNVIDLCLNQLSIILNTQLSEIDTIEESVKIDLLADLVRGTPLFALDNFIDKFDKVKNTTVNDGICIGKLVELTKHTKLTGDEIIYCENIDPHSSLPNVKGIITYKVHPSLSHLAIHAKQKKIPWAVIQKKQVLSIVGKNSLNSTYKLKAASGVTELELVADNSISTLITVKEISVNKPIKLEHDLNTPYVIPYAAINTTNVGLKGANLKNIQPVPKTLGLSFKLFKDVVLDNTDVKNNCRLLEELNINQAEQLQKIRAIICSIKLPKEFIKGLSEQISAEFDVSNGFFVRSSTNAEDLHDHPAAGVYESFYIRSLDELERAILGVYASGFTEKAWKDRRYAIMEESTFFMGVLIQPALKLTWSFVAHTHCPSLGEKFSRIEIVPGYGAALVSGMSKYLGFAHQYIYNKMTNQLFRVHYCNKNNIVSSEGDKIADYSGDLFSEDSTNTRSLIVDILSKCTEVEEKLGKAQDIEGAILQENNKLKFVFVQTRDQLIDAETNAELDIKSLNNMIGLEVMSHAQKALDVVVKNKKTKIINYYTEETAMRFIVKVLGSNSKYDLDKLKRESLININKYLEKSYFIDNNSLYRLIDEAAEVEKKAVKRAFASYSSPYISPDVFLEHVGLNKDTPREKIIDVLFKYINKFSIDTKLGVYYIQKFKNNEETGFLLLAFILIGHLTNNILYPSMIWDWGKLFKESKELFEFLKLIPAKINLTDFKKDYLDKVISEEVRVPVTAAHADELELDEFNKLESESNRKASDIQDLKSIKLQSFLLVDHIDLSNITNILSFMAFKTLDGPDLEKINYLLVEVQGIKSPTKTFEEYEKRLYGDKMDLQMLYFLIKNMTKPIKHNKLTQEEASDYLINSDILKKILDLTHDLALQKYDNVQKEMKGAMKTKRLEYEQLKAKPKSFYQDAYHYSSKKRVAYIQASSGIEEVDEKYLFAPIYAPLVVSYKVEYENDIIIGYRYTNVGLNRLNKLNLNIFGLKEFLSIIEFAINNVANPDYQNLWVSHYKPQIMATGPSCSNNRTVSVIPPDILASLIENFIDFKIKHPEYNVMLRVISSEKHTQMIKDIIKFLKTKRNLNLIKKLADKYLEDPRFSSQAQKFYTLFINTSDNQYLVLDFNNSKFI